MLDRRINQWAVVVFLMMIQIPPVHQLIHERRTSRQWRFLRLFQEVPIPASLKRYADDLASEPIFAQ